MAKRKRLSPAVGLDTSPPPSSSPAPSPATRAPIAAIAGDVATSAAFDAVRAELESARADGRMVMALPLGAVEPAYLIRDRIAMESEDMEALKDSLRRRGQQTPIEVVDLGQGQYGLISGARRIKALELLLTETGDTRFSTVQALIRRPDDRSDTYVAMIEENEIRAGLSYYERARIAFKAVEAGVFADDKTALQTLFAGVSFSKRSKIKSFMALVEAFDDVLRFPTQITERTGLALVKAMADRPQIRPALHAALKAEKARIPEQEADVIATHLTPPKLRKTPESEPEIARGVRIHARKGRVVLEGEGVTEAFIEHLKTLFGPRVR
jgi:ParB family transcriptional regulator, chromosome partitioning protein